MKIKAGRTQPGSYTRQEIMWCQEAKRLHPHQPMLFWWSQRDVFQVREIEGCFRPRQRKADGYDGKFDGAGLRIWLAHWKAMKARDQQLDAKTFQAVLKNKAKKGA